MYTDSKIISFLKELVLKASRPPYMDEYDFLEHQYHSLELLRKLGMNKFVLEEQEKYSKSMEEKEHGNFDS